MCSPSWSWWMYLCQDLLPVSPAVLRRGDDSGLWSECFLLLHGLEERWRKRSHQHGSHLKGPPVGPEGKHNSALGHFDLHCWPQTSIFTPVWTKKKHFNNTRASLEAQADLFRAFNNTRLWNIHKSTSTALSKFTDGSKLKGLIWLI